MEGLREPIDKKEYWKHRIYKAFATGKEFHTAVYDINYSVWQHIRGQTEGILGRILKPGDSLLDAGCGYGAIYEIIPDGVDYTGIDISPDLLELGKIRYPEAVLQVGDLNYMPEFHDRQFSFAVCRSMQGMVLEHLDLDTWKIMRKELLRVARHLIIMEYKDLSTHRIAYSIEPTLDGYPAEWYVEETVG